MKIALALFLLLCLPARADNTWVHVMGSWEPPANAVESMKKGLQPFVVRNAGRRTLRPWKEYVFQYQGQVDRGRRYVLVNGLCRVDPGWSLQSQIVLTVGGGPCFFHLKFDPLEGSFYDLHLSG